MRARAALLVLAAWALLPVRAGAFEPYTHNFTADRGARRRAGRLGLDRWSRLPGARRAATGAARLAAVLRRGGDRPRHLPGPAVRLEPDSHLGRQRRVRLETVAPHPPELLQPLPPSCVQSGDTGEWLELVLDRAWAVQDDPRSYGTQERSQVLAFSYGFLTHAAGDLWAHTFVNDFAQQLWPPMSEIATDVEALEVAAPQGRGGLRWRRDSRLRRKSRPHRAARRRHRPRGCPPRPRAASTRRTAFSTRP